MPLALVRSSAASKMQRLDLRIPSLGGQLLRAAHGLLGFDRQFVETEGHE